jgi:tRNA(His) 5'-end guanylyltransferase
MNDALGDRMKSFYEDRFRYTLPRKTYTLMRIDGKAFHTYTKSLGRPFDKGLIEDMNATAEYLCKNIQGAKLAYIQSDEISILLTDFDDIMTDAWFDGNLQKMTSVAASLATSEFNKLRLIRMTKEHDLTTDELLFDRIPNFRMAQFDARVFQIPSAIEVENYFIWRQQDATKNSISTVAQSLYSHKALEGKSGDQKQEMIFQKGINWNDYSSREKRGGFIEKVTYVNDVDIRTIPFQEVALTDKVRNKWETVECPVFTQEREFLKSRIPVDRIPGLKIPMKSLPPVDNSINNKKPDDSQLN